MMNLEETASAYLVAARAAKTAAQHAESLKTQLGAQMRNGQEVWAEGFLYRWKISKTPTTAYASLVEWSIANLTSDASVMIEEAKPLFAGTRTTKSLEPVK